MPSKQNIPKIIHQIWLGPKPPPHQWLDTWKNKHPEWEYHLWREDNIPPLHNQKQFDAIKDYAGKADILRVELLYRFGGVYLDADSECLRPLDHSLLRYHFFAAYENEALRPGLIGNSAIGAEPNHPIMQGLITAISQIEDVNERKPWAIVGPLLFTKVIKQYEARCRPVAILPSHTFYPIHHKGLSYTGRGKIYALQHWLTTNEYRGADGKTMNNITSSPDDFD